MVDIGNLVALYEHASQFVSQHGEGIIKLVVGSMLVLPAASVYILYHQGRQITKQYREELQRLGVPELIGLPASKIPNPDVKVNIAKRICTGGVEGTVIYSFVESFLRNKIIAYSNRVARGEEGSVVLQEALEEEDIRGLFNRKFTLADRFDDL